MDQFYRKDVFFANAFTPALYPKSIKMKLFACLFASLFALKLLAQDPILVTHSCSYDGEEAGREFYQFDPSDEADRIVAEICNAVSLSKNFNIKASNVKNALATTEGGQRYILYSTSFLEKFKSEARTRWAAYSVLAHEIGHHLNGHNFSETDPSKRKRMELEADKFSGGVLRLLSANLTEAQAGIETFGLEGESKTHPPASARREAIASGWKKQDERLREQGVATTPTTNFGLPPSPEKKMEPIKADPADRTVSKLLEEQRKNTGAPVVVTPQYLVGTWAAQVVEFDIPQTVMIELTEDYSIQGINGGISYVVIVNDDITNSGIGYWNLENGVFTQYNILLAPEGIGSVRYLNAESFELTIVNNGVPAYTGLKRVFNRVRM